MNMKATQASEAAYRPVPLECRVRRYLEAIKPFQQIRYELYSAMLPKIIIYPDGHIEHEYNFTEQQKESLRLADEAMEMIKRQMGLTPNLKLRGGLTAEQEKAMNDKATSETQETPQTARPLLSDELGDVIFPAPFSKEDTTGTCTVRDAVSYMREYKTDICEMAFLHNGREWNVEIRILRSEKAPNI